MSWERPRPVRVAPGWHAYVPNPSTFGLAVMLPRWPVEIALSVEMPGADHSPPGPAGRGGADRLGLELAEPSALLALRAAGLAWPVLDRLRGIPVLDRVPGGRAVSLPQPVELPGLAAAGRDQVRRHLTLAGTRGVADRDPGPIEVAGLALGGGEGRSGRAYGLHPGGRAARHRRTRGGEVQWMEGAGADVRVAGPFGRSVQAVVTLHGNGEPELLRPPPGGALVLRAWREADGWQVLCAVVVAAGVGLSAGRVAGRLARLALTRSWDAAALTGRSALLAARAGDPRFRTPAQVARPLPPAAFQTLLSGCLQVTEPGTGGHTPGPAPSGNGNGDGPATLSGLPRLLHELATRPLPSPPKPTGDQADGSDGRPG